MEEEGHSTGTMEEGEHSADTMENEEHSADKMEKEEHSSDTMEDDEHSSDTTEDAEHSSFSFGSPHSSPESDQDRQQHGPLLSFNAHEDARIMRLRDEMNLSWQHISEYLGRPKAIVHDRYIFLKGNNHINPPASKTEPDRDQQAGRMADVKPLHVQHTTLTPAKNLRWRRLRQWTTEEDQEILRLREAKLSYKDIARAIGNTSGGGVCARHRHLMADNRVGQTTPEPVTVPGQQSSPLSSPPNASVIDSDRPLSHDPDPRVPTRTRRAFTPAEDRVILRLRNEHHMSWIQIAEQLVGRRDGSIRNRYFMLQQLPEWSELRKGQGLEKESSPLSSPPSQPTTAGLPPSPTESRKPRQPWDVVNLYTAADDSLILSLRDDKEMGWAQIALHLAGRSAHGVRRRYKRLKQWDAKNKSAVTRDA